MSFFQLTLADWNQWGSVTSAAFMAADRASIAVTKLNRDLLFYEGLPPNPLLISHPKHQVQSGIMCCLNNFLICQLVQINAHHWYD